MASKKNALEFQNISKSFAQIRANSDISFSIQAGSIHAIVGENGAGKSTLMKILFGLYQSDSGKIFLNEKEIRFQNPIAAKKAGLGMVHQHFMLAGPMTALDHILLENANLQKKVWKRLFFPLTRKKTLQKLNQLSEKYGMHVPWMSEIERLSVGIQQRIEILKLLYHQADILILDEPTAVLTPQEIEQLFAQLKKLKSDGKTILIITHKLKEVLQIADQVTVLRQGQSIATVPIADQTIESLSELMIGRKLKPLPRAELAESKVSRVLVRSLFYEKFGTLRLNDINFDIHPSEILGIAGIEGNGQSELISAFIRPQQVPGNFSGQIQYQGQNLIGLESSEIRKLGISYFPEDRIHQGILPEANMHENFLLGKQHHDDYSYKGFLRNKNLRESVQKVFEEFDVRPQNPKLPMHKFSGGNQQKFVVGRELFHQPKLLIAAQPTRGVDIGAIETIHAELLRQRANGASILLISSELDELMKLSDRLLIIYNGRIMGTLHRQNFEEKRIGQMMTGGLQ